MTNGTIRPRVNLSSPMSGYWPLASNAKANWSPLTFAEFLADWVNWFHWKSRATPKYLSQAGLFAMQKL